MPCKSANVKNEKQYEALEDEGMSKQRAARIANTPDAAKKDGKAHAGTQHNLGTYQSAHSIAELSGTHFRNPTLVRRQVGTRLLG